MKKVILSSFLLISLFLFVGCGNKDVPEPVKPAPQPEQTEAMPEPVADVPVQADIIETAKDAGNFSTLVAALDKAGLVDTLQGEGPFTVFAPTDDAFTDLLNDLGITAAELLENPDLSDILLYHVIPGKVMATEVLALTDGTSVDTVGGEKVIITFQGGDVYINNAKVSVTDIETSNGVIHVIDKVLLPPMDTEEPISNPKTGDTDL